LIANEILWRKRKVSTLKMVATMLSEGIMCKSTGLIMRGVVPPLSYALMVCTRTTKCYIYQTRNIVMVCTYVLFLWLSFTSLGTWNMLVSPSPQSIVILKIMFVSLLCMTLFDTVLYCFTYQLLSCFIFVDNVCETNGQQERESTGCFSREREKFSSKAGTEVKSQIVCHIYSVGFVLDLCSRKHFQILSVVTNLCTFY